MKKIFNQEPKTILISLSPNTEKDDVQLAKKTIGDFKSWKKGEQVKTLEGELKRYFAVKYTVLFNSGRACLSAILEVLQIKEGDEVLLQGFTCNSAIIPILRTKAKPVFVDIEDTLNMSPDDLEKKISPRSKAIMVQHTFGFPAQMDKIMEISKKHNLILIEDCAHSLGAKFQDKLCGTMGDIAFFSFGRDKIISSVFGGFITTNNKELGRKIINFKEKLNYPSGFWIFQQLLHPILINSLIFPLYRFPTLGKFCLIFFQKIRILSKAVSSKEKKGKFSKGNSKKFPNALAILALNQFQKLERFNFHRREIAKIYEENLKESPAFLLPFSKNKEQKEIIFMKYPVLVQDSEKILKEFRKKRILLNDGWRKVPVVPPGNDIKKMGYIFGSCPKAEEVASKILNLPTHINLSKEKAKEIADLLKKF
ncbi:MAG: aminotransferase class V-fold PLP-dependent enzyme [Candidatus Nealsonbacteria bacterium]|nr:aminotransferase class V-fold PLP-dependent enzyme [Candidatus Nealsonbacteria bacterium]